MKKVGNGNGTAANHTIGDREQLATPQTTVSNATEANTPVTAAETSASSVGKTIDFARAVAKYGIRGLSNKFNNSYASAVIP